MSSGLVLAGRGSVWFRTERKELAHQLRHRPKRVQTVQALTLTMSAIAALAMVGSNWFELRQEQMRKQQTDLGLLDLRVNQHRTTVLDWGHWDSMYSYAGGAYPTFLERELKPSSIIDDHQLMLIFWPDGRLRAQVPDDLLSQTMRQCLRQRLARLRQLTGGAPKERAFGLMCHSAQQVVLGAGTGIRPSSGASPERGWVLHLSTLERPSYNPYLAQAFRRMSDAIALVPAREGQGHGDALRSISELLPADQLYVLRPNQSPWQLALVAVEAMLLAWLALNLLLLLLLWLVLLTVRQRRLPGRIRELQEIRSARKVRRQLGDLLLNRRQLLLSLGIPSLQADTAWVLALRVRAGAAATIPAGEGGREGAERTLHHVARVLEGRLSPMAMGLMAEDTMALVFQGDSGEEEGQRLRQRLELLLEEIQRTSGDAGELQLHGAVAPMARSGREEQLSYLAASLGDGSPPPSLLRLVSRDGAQALSRGPAAGGGTRGLLPWLTQLADGCYALSPLLESDGGEVIQAGQELLFSPGATAAPGQVPERWRDADDTIDGESAHRIDLYMLAQAISCLQQPEGVSEMILISISSSSLLDEQAFQALINGLEPLSLSQRQRLILELDETAIFSREIEGRAEIMALKTLGIRIAVNHFGSGITPIQDVFSVEPDFLKLTASASQRMHDANTENMVEFLISYCRYNHCQLVLQGLRSTNAMRYWMRHGVRFFQMAADCPVPAALQAAGAASL